MNGTITRLPPLRGTRSAVCLRAPVREGALPALRDALAAADAEVTAGRSPLTRVAGVHFARWLVVPGDRSLSGDAVADSLVYTADVDGSVADHLEQLDTRAGALVDAVFVHCNGYPVVVTGGARLSWLRARRIENAATYVNVVGLSV